MAQVNRGERRPLYLMRHGQTAWNLEGRLQGGRDSPLTRKGERQAEAVGFRLRDEAPSSILASPLGRASRTAAIIAGILGISVETDARLGELRFGEAEGLTLTEIDAHWPGFREERETDKWRIRWPGGESYRDADARIGDFIEEVLSVRLDEKDSGPLAVVGHETINMILLGRLLALDPSIVVRLGQPNDVVYRLKDGLIDHAYLSESELDWVPGMLQKRSDEILHIFP